MSGLKEGNLKHKIFQGMDNNSTDIINKYDPQEETPDIYLMKEIENSRVNEIKKKIETNQKKKKVERFAMKILDGKHDEVLKKNYDVTIDLKRRGL